MRPVVTCASATLIVGAIVASAQTDQLFKPGKLSPAEVAALQPGLTLRFYAKAGDATSIDARRVRLAALHVPKGAAPTPFVAAGPIHTKLTGFIKNPLKGDHRFRLVGAGTVKLRINGKDLLTDFDKEAETELAKNYNKIEIIYSGPTNGDATVRLEWSGEKFGFEPLPPDMLYSRKDEVDLVEKTKLREGRELFANLHCASCHDVAPKLASFTPAMPEYKSMAPRLDNAGHRFQYDWLVGWIANPRDFRPEATMPRMLSGPGAEVSAADIAAYLMSVKVGEAPKPIAPNAKPADGAALAKKLGCSTCHRPDDPKKPDELGRLSQFYTAAKYAPNALGHYLRSPQRRHEWTRMPDFQLTDIEAASLEAHIRDRSKGIARGRPKGDPKRGEKLYREIGCVRCHGMPNEKESEPFKLIKLTAPEKGCLAAENAASVPNFGLTSEQRAALTSFVRTDGSSLTRETPAEFSLRQVKSLRCDSCHRRDGNITRWHAVLEDEGKVPELLPSLTWVGEKLQPHWTKKLFHGQSDHSARPWLKARMPAFPARAEMLAVGLSHEHGFGVNDDPRPKLDDKLAAIGEKLIPQQGGFNCNNCHGVGKTPAIQPFEAPGINLRDAAVRLRYSYYQRWMLAPDRVDVTMRMPVFAVDGKTTQLLDVFQGDARKQYDALWHYIQTLPGKTK